MKAHAGETVLTRRAINRATLARQMLLDRERVTPLAAIERLVGMQAQWPRPPFVGLWSRVHAFTREQLTQLFDDRRVVRGTFLRATIHVTSTNDYLSFRPVIQPVLNAAMHGILRDRIAGVDLERLAAQARAILAEQPLTFGDLRKRFLQANPKADERAMGYAVRMQLPLVQVPDRKAPWGFPAQASFAPADQWLGRAIPRSPADPEPLILRYLAGYGPAYVADVQAWSGLAAQTIRDAVDRLRPRLVTFRDERKRELIDLPDAPRPPEGAPAPVRLVPEYDNLITARADERFVERAHRPRVFLPALRIAATVLVDGFAAGTWTIAATKRAATVTIEPFGTWSSKIRSAVVAEAEALARFAEPEAKTVDVKVTTA
jgi:hypothetical protein